VTGQVREQRRPGGVGIGETRLEGFGEPLVERPTLPRQELRRDDLAKECVTEPDTAGILIELEHEAVERIAERGADGVDRSANDTGEQLVVDRPAGDRQRGEDGPRGRGKGRDAGGEDVDEGRGRGGLARWCGEQLLDEERVALRPGPDTFGERRV